MKTVSDENIFEHDDGGASDADGSTDLRGFDIIFEASELGLPPGEPPAEITLKLPNKEVIKFEFCGPVVGSCDRLLHWSYWNKGDGGMAINLKILND